MFLHAGLFYFLLHLPVEVRVGVVPVLPSYTALKPCALTAKSVVNHRARMDPLLTIGDGSRNPDNLERKDRKHLHLWCSKLRTDVGRTGEALLRHEFKHYENQIVNCVIRKSVFGSALRGWGWEIPKVDAIFSVSVVVLLKNIVLKHGAITWSNPWSQPSDGFDHICTCSKLILLLILSRIIWLKWFADLLGSCGSR